MATIFSGTNDGYVALGLGTSFSAIRQGDTSTGGVLSFDSNNLRDVIPVTSFHSTRGGPSSYGLRRSFFEFDTSGISDTPDDAVLRIYGFSQSSADVIVVRGEQGGTLSTGDFDSFPSAAVTALGNSDGTGTGTFAGISGLTYSAELTSWTTSGFNTITLNATALADMVSLDLFKVCLMEYDHDYLDIVGSGIQSVGFWWTEADDTERDPKIVYTPATAAVTDNAVFFGSNF